METSIYAAKIMPNIITAGNSTIRIIELGFLMTRLKKTIIAFMGPNGEDIATKDDAMDAAHGTNKTASTKREISMSLKTKKMIDAIRDIGTQISDLLSLCCASSTVSFFMENHFLRLNIMFVIFYDSFQILSLIVLDWQIMFYITSS